MITRRTFMSRLGLGAGAVVLSPIAESLVSEALGQPLVRKRAVFFVYSEGMHPTNVFAPPEILALGKTSAPLLDGPQTQNFTLPPFLKAVEKHRNRLLMVDGLSNVTGDTHATMYGALSCLKGALNSPVGPTIDQLLAAQLSKGQPRKSVLFGVRRNVTSPTFTNFFASGAGRPEPVFGDTGLLFKAVFGEIAPAPGMVDKSGIRRKLVMDGLRGDIRRLQGAFAGTERRKLEVYLAALEEMESRLLATRTIDCKAPAANAAIAAPANGGRGASADQFLRYMEQSFTIAAAALACGITSVVGIGLGGGLSHHFGTAFPTTEPCDGHQEDKTKAGFIERHTKQMAYLAQFADYLQGFKEGSGTAFDTTAMFYLPENAESHHSSSHKRWPLVVLGNAGGALKTEGRFLRYAERGKTGWRSLADFFQTVGQAYGVPLPEFGVENGADPVKGPLAELLA